MVETLLKLIITELLTLLPEEKVRAAVDNALDKIENEIVKTGNKIDDAIVLPLIKKVIREPFGIEDKD